jgi:hypothetical protein
MAIQDVVFMVIFFFFFWGGGEGRGILLYELYRPFMSKCKFANIIIFSFTHRLKTLCIWVISVAYICIIKEEKLVKLSMPGTLFNEP